MRLLVSRWSPHSRLSLYVARVSPAMQPKVFYAGCPTCHNRPYFQAWTPAQNTLACIPRGWAKAIKVDKLQVWCVSTRWCHSFIPTGLLCLACCELLSSKCSDAVKYGGSFAACLCFLVLWCSTLKFDRYFNQQQAYEACRLYHMYVVVVAYRPPVKKRKHADKELESRVRTYSASSTSSDSADDLDTGLSIVDDEALALKLLTS